MQSIISNQSGIYQIRNLINGKIYIGSAKNFKVRWGVHRVKLRAGKHHSSHLQYAWNKYGEENFVFEILQIVENVEELLLYEQKYLNDLRPFVDEFGYNIVSIAGNTFGRYHTEKSKKKISDHRKGKRAGVDHPMYGKHHTEGIRRKIRENRKGKCAGVDHPMYGKHHTEEAKTKMSKSHTGFHHSEETKEKMRHDPVRCDRFGAKNPMYGKHLTDETKRKISESNKGKHVLSAEARKRIGDKNSGENGASAKLTELKVAQIREKYNMNTYTQSQLAQEYGVSPGTIWDLLNGRTWISRTDEVIEKSNP